MNPIQTPGLYHFNTPRLYDWRQEVQESKASYCYTKRLKLQQVGDWDRPMSMGSGQPLMEAPCQVASGYNFHVYLR